VSLQAAAAAAMQVLPTLQSSNSTVIRTLVVRHLLARRDGIPAPGLAARSAANAGLGGLRL
jgi:hypothetical protein